MHKNLLLLISVLILMADPAIAQRRSPGIEGQQAPGWEVSEWHNLPHGVDALDVADFRGKVVYVFCFQSWCPGCHAHGFPTLRRVHERFEGRDEVAFVAIQTVFEGFHSNTADNGRDDLRDYGLDIPFGQAAGSASESGHGATPDFMRRYRTGGTPWTILIDPEGVVRFNGFSITPEQAIAAIERLLPAGSED